MFKNMNQTEQAALKLLQIRMDPKNPGYGASDCVTQALTGEAKCYFDSWVLPVLQFLVEGEAYFGQGDDIRRQLGSCLQRARDTKAAEAVKQGT